MTTGMPELGSKISLISKADIRYEGRLFTVDPQECTIALASVRSFGTEDRETQYPVPAQNQVYDYILFRGSDIKDIRVINNVAHPQPLNDPAIMQLSVPPTLGGQTFQGHPVLGPMGPQMGQFAGAYGAMGGLGAGMGASLGNMQRDGRMNVNSKPTSVLDLIGGGSRSTTPISATSRKSPTSDQGVQAGGNSRDDKKVVKPPGQHRNVQGQQHQQGRRSRDRRGSSKDRDDQHNRPTGGRPHQQNQGYHHQNNYGYHQQNSHGGYPQNQGYQSNYNSNYRNEHNQSGTRGNWVNRGPMRSRGRPRGGGGGYRNPPVNQGGTGSNNKSKNTLKFDNDYDFELANTEFEELRSQLGKVKIDETGSVSAKSETNGDVGDKKDDSGNETGAGDTEQEEEHEIFYDKKKSFFDKISCEAVERAKGKSQRTDWRVERKLNSETFGVSSTRRGHFRGRGGYRGVGYRGGYRQNNYRQPQRNNKEQNSSSAAPQQQQQQPQGNRLTETQKKTDLSVAEIKTSTAVAIALPSINVDTDSSDKLEDNPLQASDTKVAEPVQQ